MRRARVDWMQGADDAILEFLKNDPAPDLIATPRVIGANISYSTSTVRKRVRELENYNLIEYTDPDDGLYQITDRGIGYLSGELNADDLEAPE